MSRMAASGVSRSISIRASVTSWAGPTASQPRSSNQSRSSMAISGSSSSIKIRDGIDMGFRPSPHLVEKFVEFLRQCLLRVRFGQQIDIRIEPTVVHDGVFRVTSCEKHRQVWSPLECNICESPSTYASWQDDVGEQQAQTIGGSLKEREG